MRWRLVLANRGYSLAVDEVEAGRLKAPEACMNDHSEDLGSCFLSLDEVEAGLNK
jgi:hypothetical protein